MLLPRVLLVPPLPTLVLDEHRRHLTPMLAALHAEAEALVPDPPDLIVALSARWRSDGPFHVDVGARHRTLTDYSGFGVELRYDCAGHPAAAHALVEAGIRAQVRVGPANRGVDSGVTVPLHFLLPRRQVAVVPLSVADLPAEAARAWGAVVRRALDERDERVLFVAGGLIAADLHSWSFRRDVPEAEALDEHVLATLRSGEWGALHDLDAKTLERAHPDAELRHLDVLRGVLGADVPGTLLAYESAPGVGAALMAFAATATAPRATRAAHEREG